MTTACGTERAAADKDKLLNNNTSGNISRAIMGNSRNHRLLKLCFRVVLGGILISLIAKNMGKLTVA
jgi:hypothetical protein